MEKQVLISLSDFRELEKISESIDRTIFHRIENIWEDFDKGYITNEDDYKQTQRELGYILDDLEKYMDVLKKITR